MGQGTSSSIEDQLKRIAEIGSDSTLSQRQKKKEIRHLINSWNDSYKHKPNVYLYPDDKDYFILHGVLKSGEHVLYIQQGDNGQALIIHDLKDHEELSDKGQEMMAKINQESHKLKNSFNSNAGYLVDERSTEAASKVQALLEETPAKLEKYIGVMGGPFTIGAINLLNKIREYLNFGNGILQSPNYNIPIDGDVLHSLTSDVLKALKVQ